jgi:hypothetical protein
MKTLLSLAGAVLALTLLAPSNAEAQRRGYRAGGGYGGGGARRVVVAGPRYRGGAGYYRRGYRPGVGLAVGAGALAVGAAAAGASYYGGDQCLQQQQTAYGLQWVRVC